MSCRLIIVEGIMGSGKSRTTQWLTGILEHQGYAIRSVGEAFWPHPTRAMTDLKKPLAPWNELTPIALAHKSLVKWSEFANDTLNSDEVVVLDGQLFHGDLTSLMMMEMSFAKIRDYILAVEKEIVKLKPLLIYYYQDNIARALTWISTLRSPEWLELQLSWKLQSPYCCRRKQTGMTGLIEFYKEYRRLTDYLFERLKISKCKIENHEQTWNYYRQTIRMELSRQSGFQFDGDGEIQV